MTERPRASVERSADRLRIGSSALDWDGRRLRIVIAERTAVRKRPVEGEVVVTPGRLQPESFALDASGRHRWRPISVDAGVEVRMAAPATSWSGRGYLDFNAGAAPLERDFRAWSWSRTAADGAGAAEVFYEVQARDGDRRALALQVGREGVATLPTPPTMTLPHTVCRLPRRTRWPRRGARIVRTLEDTPFYARSSVRLRDADGAPRLMMHEALALDRFTAPLMQWALPYRIPREA